MSYKCQCGAEYDMACNANVNAVLSTAFENKVALTNTGDDGKFVGVYLAPEQALDLAADLVKLATKLDAPMDKLQTVADSIDALLVAKLTKQ